MSCEYGTDEEVVARVKKSLGQSLAEDARFADVFFSLQIVQMIVDHHLDERIAEITGLEEVGKVTADYYDKSFEVYGVPAEFECTPAMLVEFGKMGFHQFWTHVHEEHPRQTGEHFYHCKLRT